MLNAKCEVRGAECEECIAKGEVWSLEHKVSLDVSLQRCHAQVIFLEKKSATGSHKARTHGPGWGTAPATSVVHTVSVFGAFHGMASKWVK